MQKCLLLLSGGQKHTRNTFFTGSWNRRFLISVIQGAGFVSWDLQDCFVEERSMVHGSESWKETDGCGYR